ncbi:uncharacterized [Tachysurus ichikawai]
MQTWPGVSSHFLCSEEEASSGQPGVIKPTLIPDRKSGEVIRILAELMASKSEVSKNLEKLLNLQRRKRLNVTFPNVLKSRAFFCSFQQRSRLLGEFRTHPA